MDTLSILAAGGMRAKINQLDVLANNLANTNTPGYKADGEFQNVYLSEQAASDPNDPARIPDVSERWIDYSQGTLQETGNPLDLAFYGRGFLTADTNNGVVLTRNGSLRMNPKGFLETSEGYRVRNNEGKPIQLDPALAVNILKDGSIQQSGRTVAKIGLFDAATTDIADKAGHGYFRLTDVKKLKAAAADTELHQGKIEAANVSPAESSIRLVTLMRQFEMLQRAASIGADMNKKAIEEVARVSA